MLLSFFIICCAKERVLRSSWILNECNLYVIGLHAVQFGHNWIKKIPGTAKIGRGRKPSPIGCQRNFLSSIISKVDKHVVLLLIIII